MTSSFLLSTSAPSSCSSSSFVPTTTFPESIVLRSQTLADGLSRLAAQRLDALTSDGTVDAEDHASILSAMLLPIAMDESEEMLMKRVDVQYNWWVGGEPLSHEEVVRHKEVVRRARLYFSLTEEGEIAPPTEPSVDLVDFRAIRTPFLDAVLAEQEFTEEEKRWLYTFMGRELCRDGSMDAWSMNGKSTSTSIPELSPSISTLTPSTSTPTSVPIPSAFAYIPRQFTVDRNSVIMSHVGEVLVKRLTHLDDLLHAIETHIPIGIERNVDRKAGEKIELIRRFAKIAYDIVIGTTDSESNPIGDPLDEETKQPIAADRIARPMVGLMDRYAAGMDGLSHEDDCRSIHLPYGTTLFSGERAPLIDFDADDYKDPAGAEVRRAVMNPGEGEWAVQDMLVGTAQGYPNGSTERMARAIIAAAGGTWRNKSDAALWGALTEYPSDDQWFAAVFNVALANAPSVRALLAQLSTLPLAV